MAPASLLDMATRTAISHRASIVDFADIPYKLAQPILRRFDDPGQLHEVELNSPQMAKEDAELWIAFLERDVPGWRRIYPIKPTTSINYKLFRKISALKKKDEHAAEEALRQQFQALDQKKKMNETQITARPLPTPIEYANGRKVGFGASKRLTYSRPIPRPGSTNNGIAAIRRKAAEAANARRMQQTVRKPSDAEVLRNARAQIRHAPSSMVVDLLPQTSRAQYLQRAPLSAPPSLAGPAPRHFAIRKKPEQQMLDQANRIIDEDRRTKGVAGPSTAPQQDNPSISPVKEAPKPAPATTPRKRVPSSIFAPVKRRKL
jgi:elongin-A